MLGTQPTSDGPEATGTLASLDRALTKLEDFLSFVSAIFILLLMVFGTANAIGRKIFNAPIWGYNDIVTLSMVAFTFLAIAAMQRVGGHIRMELVVRNMKGRTLWIAEFVGIAIALFIIAVLIYYSTTALGRAFTLGDSTIDRELPTWPSKMWVPIAFSVLILRLILQAWGYGRLIITPDAVPIAVPIMAAITEIADKEISDALGEDDDENQHSLNGAEAKDQANG